MTNLSSSAQSVRRFLISTFAIAALAVVGACGSHHADAASGKKEVRVEGRVASVDVAAGTVTIQTRTIAVLVRINGATKIERNGVRRPLSAFKVGDRGQARFSDAAAAFASKVEAVGP